MKIFSLRKLRARHATVPKLFGVTRRFGNRSGFHEKNIESGQRFVYQKLNGRFNKISDSHKAVIDPKKTLQHFFLPKGYPHSVSSDYSKFYGWSFLQNTCGSASYVLSTKVMLLSIGVGSSLVEPGSAALSWILKDGLGCFGIMLAASKFGTNFDLDTKANKFRGDILHNFGVFLELSTSMFPRYFIVLASLGNVFKGLAGLTNGACRASLNRQFSQQENMGDITAKTHSQGILAYVVGMSLGIALSSLPFNSPGGLGLYATFFSLAFAHLFCSFQAVSRLRLKTLNRRRLDLLIFHFLNRHHDSSFCSIEAINQQETILISPHHHPIELGCSLIHLDHFDLPENQSFLIIFSSESSKFSNLSSKSNEFSNLSSKSNEFSNLSSKSNESSNLFSKSNEFSKKHFKIQIFLRDDIQQIEILEAYFLAQVSISQLCSFEEAKKLWPGFLDLLNHHGWNLDHIHLKVGPYRWEKQIDKQI